MEVSKEEFRTPGVGEKLLWSDHAVLCGVVEVSNLGLVLFETRASIYEVVPGTVSVSALAGVCFFQEIFPESAGVIGGEGVACCKTQGGGGGMACGGEVTVWPEFLMGCQP